MKYYKEIKVQNGKVTVNLPPTPSYHLSSNSKYINYIADIVIDDGGVFVKARQVDPTGLAYSEDDIRKIISILLTVEKEKIVGVITEFVESCKGRKQEIAKSLIRGLL